MQTDPNFAAYLYQPVSGRPAGAAGLQRNARLRGRLRPHRPRVVDGDRAAIAKAAVRIGYAAADDAPERIAAVVDMCLLVCEPLRHRGRYEFGASDLPSRVRDLGYELAVRRRLLRPPPQTMFLHRKLVGSFLLLARIGARVDARADPALPPRALNGVAAGQGAPGPAWISPTTRHAAWR